MVQLEGLAFLLAGLGTVLVLAAIASLVLLRRRSPVVVASGPSYAMLQALGGSVWVMSTIIFNGHFSAYNPREVSLPTCFFWRYWMTYTFGFSVWFASHLVRLDRVHGVYNKRRGAEYPFWSSVMLDYVLYWFFFSVLGELFYITADASTLNTLAEERGSDCGYPVALFLFALCLMASHFVYRIVCVSKIRDPRLGHMRTVIVTAAGVLVQLLFAAIEQGAGVSSSLTGAFGLRATHTTLVIAVVLSSLLLTHGGVVFLVYTSKNRKVMVENFLRQFKGHQFFDDADVDLRGCKDAIAARIAEQKLNMHKTSSKADMLAAAAAARQGSAGSASPRSGSRR